LIITIKEDIFEKILENPVFTCDGCACGEVVYPLNENLHIYVYRSCRKSSMTPDEKLWHIHEIYFYKNANYIYHTNNDDIEYLDYVEVEDEDYLENVRLNPEQENILIERLKEVSKDLWRNEYRNQD
jgi:hypothetical protein